MRATAFSLLASAVAAAATRLVAQASPSPELMQAAAGYAAKIVASAVFVSGRKLDSVLAEELSPTRPLEALVRPLLRFQIDREAGTVTCTLGKASATAIETGNLGCTLLATGCDAATLRQRRAPGLADVQPDPAKVDWPLGDRLQPDGPPHDRAAVAAAIDRAFANGRDKEKGKDKVVHTRAVVVVYRGQLIAERYAPGYDAAMPLPGWSITKTLTHALLGVRQQQGKFDPKAPLLLPEWPADDPRARIGVTDLLTMRSGLRWNEDYDDPQSDALRMLFGSADMAAAYARQPVASPPGHDFVYSSGATNLLCRVLRTTFGSDGEYWAFPRTCLFQRLGMRTAVLETDASGTFVGSSYGFACARDWARLGLLYADDGVCQGQRLLPVGYVAAAGTVHPAGDGRYGQHLWCNRDPDGDGPKGRPWPALPDDLLRMDGHEGQYVVVVPSAQLVLVRLGCTKNGGFDLRGFVADVLAATNPQQRQRDR